MLAGSLSLSGTWACLEMLKGSFEMNPWIQGVSKMRNWMLGGRHHSIPELASTK